MLKKHSQLLKRYAQLQNEVYIVFIFKKNKIKTV